MVSEILVLRESFEAFAQEDERVLLNPQSFKEVVAANCDHVVVLWRNRYLGRGKAQNCVGNGLHPRKIDEYDLIIGGSRQARKETRIPVRKSQRNKGGGFGFSVFKGLPLCFRLIRGLLQIVK